MTLVLAQYLVAEVLLEILTDNENDLTKSATDSIEDRIVHDGFAVRTQSVELFQTTVTAAHTGCQNK